QPGAHAVAARPHPRPQGSRHDGRVRRARHAHGAAHRRLGGRDGGGPRGGRGPARVGHEGAGGHRRLPRRPPGRRPRGRDGSPRGRAERRGARARRGSRRDRSRHRGGCRSPPRGGRAMSTPQASPAAAPEKPSAPYVVELDNVVAGYLPGVNILNGASLTAAKGELIGIIGPNGAGKSTMLKAIFGQVKVRSGAVRLNGEDITGLRANKLVAKGVGFVPQTNNVFPSLTIAENLQMGAYQRPKIVAERIEFVASIFPDLAKRLQQRAGSLSGGERQMVAMGRALMMDPHVLLLDEPSAGLSPSRQDEAFIRVSEINKACVTTIMVEQNARRCLQICDRGYVLDRGGAASTRSRRELVNDPNVIGLHPGTLGT